MSAKPTETRIAADPSSLVDAQLVARCRDGDDSAWEELVERFSRYVYAICIRSFSLGREAAEDVFQEVFARAYEQLDRLRDDGAIKPWLAQTTRRLCIDHLRKGGREEVVEEVPEPDDPPDWEEELDHALTVRAALGSLPDECQEVLDRFFARDESYATISGALDIPAGTIASRISRCLAKLREALSDGGLESGLVGTV